jgi:hypothetical protein
MLGGEGLEVRFSAGWSARLFTALILWLRPATGQAPEVPKYHPDRAARAEELLRQAQDAAGGEALRGVTSLTASISLRRVVEYIAVTSPTNAVRRDKNLKGRISIECSFPDKFLKRISTSTLSGYKYSYLEAVNGDRAWRDPPLQAVATSRDRHAIDVSDFERSLAYQAQGARQQLAFYTLALLARVLPGGSLQFNSAGWTEIEGRKADVILAFGLGDYNARLLFDQKSHLLVGFESSFFAVRRLPVTVESFVLSYSDGYRLAEKARQERLAQNRRPQQSSIQIRLSDHRPVAGVLLPHQITTIIDGRLAEELEVTKYRINTRINPNDFAPKPARK